MSQQRGGVAAVQAARRQAAAGQKKAVMMNGMEATATAAAAHHAHGGEKAGGRGGQEIGITPHGRGGWGGHQRHAVPRWVGQVVVVGQVGWEGGLGMAGRVVNGGCVGGWASYI